MRVSKAYKAIFIMVNHASATLMPQDIAARVIGTASRSDVSQASGSGAGSSMLSSMNIFPSLFSRQANNGNNNNDAPACQRCRKKCAKRFIKDPDNCRKCIRCPKGQKGNSDSTRCIGENEKDDKDKEKDKKDKEERYKKKKELMKVEYKKNSYPRKKDNMKREWDDREKKRIDNKNRIKVRFMGRCLTLVPLAMGGEFAAEFAGDYFDEAFLEHYAGDMLQHWPEGQELAPWDKEEDVDDGIFADDAFIEQYVAYGNEHTKRWLNDLSRRDPNATLAYAEDNLDLLDLSEKITVVEEPAAIAARHSSLPYDKKPGDLIVRDDLEERFFWLIPIFTAIATTVARVAPALVRAGAALLRVSKGAVKVAKGKGSKNSFKTQADGFGKIAREGNKFWRSCLKKEGPPR